MNEETFKKKAIRHGEVMITPIDALPANVEQIFEGNQYVVGHSESGHHHVAVADDLLGITIFKPKGADSQELFMRVTSDARLEHRKSHDQHETKSLLQGLYLVTIKKAYNYFTRRAEKVVD